MNLPGSSLLRAIGDWRRERDHAHENARVAYRALLQAGDRLRRSHEVDDALAVGADTAIFDACVGHVEAIGAERVVRAAKDWREALAARNFGAAEAARRRLLRAAGGGSIQRLLRRLLG
jgi:hypothetical protein